MKTLSSYHGICIEGLALVGMIFSAAVLTLISAHAQEENAPCPKPYINRCIPAAAKAGAQVEIKGNRFGRVQGVVSFAPGIEAKVATWEYKRIAVIVPAGAESGPVTITLPCGERSNQQHFTVVAPPQQ